MAWYDDALSWLGKGNNASNLLNVGTGIYDLYNRGQVQDQLNTAATSQLVDPFGAANRNFFQGQLLGLHSNPSAIQNLPGYQFGLEQSEKALMRHKARAGHYLGSGSYEDLMRNAADYNEKFFGQHSDRLAQLSGAQFGPNAGAYSDLTQTAASGKSVQGSGILDIGKEALKLFDNASGTADAASGGDGTKLSDKAIQKAKEWLGGKPTSGAVDLTANDLSGSSNFYGDAPAGSGGELTPTEFDAGIDSGYGDAPGPSLAPFSAGAGFGTFGQGANAVSDLYQYNAPVEGLSTAGAGAAAAGGALGAYGLTTALGGEEELGAGGAQATNAIGGVAGSVAGGAIAGGLGATAGGAGAGAAAGGFAAGPLIPVALAMMAYGGITEGKAMDRYKGQVWKSIFGDSAFNPSTTRSGPDHGYGDTGSGRNNYMQWRAPSGEQFYVPTNLMGAQDKGTYMSSVNLYRPDENDELQRYGAWSLLGAEGSKIGADPYGGFLSNEFLDRRRTSELQSVAPNNNGQLSLAHQVELEGLLGTPINEEGQQLQGWQAEAAQGQTPSNLGRAIESGWTPNADYSTFSAAGRQAAANNPIPEYDRGNQQ